jgi:hypothetical protein
MRARGLHSRAAGGRIVTAEKSTRVTIVVPAAVDQRLRELAQAQGRSISNLAARLLREALRDGGGDGSAQ